MLYNTDAVSSLMEIPSDSIDALITDPPAGISFMNKEWDKPTDFIKDMTEIYKECLRVLKPGAHGLVWAIPRTSHWTATALEQAGFEIRDVITHIFGSGFPKSLDVSKAIDKMYGAEREDVGKLSDFARDGSHRNGSIHSDTQRPYQGDNTKGSSSWDALVTIPSTQEAKQWQGFGTGLKPSCERWVLVHKPMEPSSEDFILVRKPLGESTVAKNVLKWSTGSLNIDASRIKGSGNDETRSAEISINCEKEKQYHDYCMSCLSDGTQSMEQLSQNLQNKDMQQTMPFHSEIEKQQSALERREVSGSGRLYICPHGKRVYVGTSLCDGTAFEEKAKENRSGSPFERDQERQSNREPEDLSRCRETYNRKSCESVSANGPLLMSQGRWPSNLVLSHNEDCELVGTKEVSTDSHQADKTIGFGKRPYKGNENEPERKYKETIESWKCTESCSVAMLDEQSGITKSAPQRRTPRGVYQGNSLLESKTMNLAGDKEGEGNFSDSGGASRFFACFPMLKHSKNSECKNSCANHVKKNLRIFLAIIEHIVPMNAEVKGDEQLALNVKSVLNQCDLCATHTAHILAEIKSWVSKNKALPAFLDFIGSFKNSFPIQSLVSIVVKWANIGIIPTTTDLMILFGCVHLVIEESIKQANHENVNGLEPATRFRYVAKASKKDRGEGNNHPTVKSSKLMEYLIKLITPPNGTVLDPFMGSGSTGVAAKRLGFDFIGIEKEVEYFEIAQNRIEKCK